MGRDLRFLHFSNIVYPIKIKTAGDPIGCYTYEKRKADGASFPVETTVYPVSVEKLENKFPEVKQRKRAWYRPKEAAKLVNEPELRGVFESDDRWHDGRR